MKNNMTEHFASVLTPSEFFSTELPSTNWSTEKYKVYVVDIIHRHNLNCRDRYTYEKHSWLYDTGGDI